MIKKIKTRKACKQCGTLTHYVPVCPMCHVKLGVAMARQIHEVETKVLSN